MNSTGAMGLDPTAGDWWWQYGLDGIVGGLVGGLVTGLAVWFTIRHERRLAARAELRAAVARLQGTVLKLTFSSPESWDADLADNADEAERLIAHAEFETTWGDWLVELWSEVTLAEALASGLDPGLASVLTSASDWISDNLTGVAAETFDPNVPQAFSATLHAYLFEWLADPKKFRKKPETDWDADLADD